MTDGVGSDEEKSAPRATWSALQRPARLLIYLLIALTVVEMFDRASVVVGHVFSVALLFVFASIIALLLTPVVDRMQCQAPVRFHHIVDECLETSWTAVSRGAAMGLEQYVVDAVVLEGRSPREIARSHGISKSWIYALVARFRAGGFEALAPRSRRPHSCSHQVTPALQAAIVELRHQLHAAGYDCGAATIRHHLGEHLRQVPSTATVWRILSRHGLVTPQPHKRPRSSFIRFEAALPNELWQADTTHWRLADGTDVEILNVLDDHSRLLTASDAFITVKAADVVETFYAACDSHGFPAALLTDNGAVFSGKSRKGKVLLESELERLGITFKHSTPYHPQTCGKVERFHQTLKRFLAKQPPPRSLPELQLQLDTFRAYYNQRRPHRAVQGRTPLVAFTARITARPAGATAPTHFRVRHDRIDNNGTVTLRYLSRLHHIGVGRAHAGEQIRLLVANKEIRILTEDGLLLRELTLDPTRDYQPRGVPLGRPRVHDHPRQASTMS